MNKHNIFLKGQIETLFTRNKFVPKKKCSPKKGLPFASISDFKVWITLPSIYV